jgi:putative membrane protein
MSQLMYRSALAAAVSLAAFCPACSSDQKTSNTPDTVSPSESPADTSAPPPGDAAMPAPNGEPMATPPSAPPPQSLNQATPSNAVAMPQANPGEPATPQLTQAQIAMVADLANSSEIEQAKVAQSKAKAASVKNFAAMMIKHHTEAKTEQDKLFKQLKLTPTQSQKATALKQDADKTLGELRAATGASFDQRYIDTQVEAHQKVLDALNKELLPAASDPELVNGLNKMKATVQSHLEQAKAIQVELATGSSAR